MDDIFLIKFFCLNKLVVLIRECGIKKKYLVYVCVDYIVENEDIIVDWVEFGLFVVFIGLEAMMNLELDLMDKECFVDLNEKLIVVC